MLPMCGCHVWGVSECMCLVVGDVIQHVVPTNVCTYVCPYEMIIECVCTYVLYIRRVSGWLGVHLYILRRASHYWLSNTRNGVGLEPAASHLQHTPHISLSCRNGISLGDGTSIWPAQHPSVHGPVAAQHWAGGGSPPEEPIQRRALAGQLSCYHDRGGSGPGWERLGQPGGDLSGAVQPVEHYLKGEWQATCMHIHTHIHRYVCKLHVECMYVRVYIRTYIGNTYGVTHICTFAGWGTLVRSTYVPEHGGQSDCVYIHTMLSVYRFRGGWYLGSFVIFTLFLITSSS